MKNKIFRAKQKFCITNDLVNQSVTDWVNVPF